MSRVYTATETALGRKVVVKLLPPDLAEGVSVERFKREIQLAAQLQQAHIVPLLAAGESGGLPYYTMPLVEGHSLRTRLAAGPLPVTEAIGIMRDVAKALAYAHEHGVVHRDIKPDNVLLSGGSAVVTDFGVAKALSASKRAPGGTLTQIGTSLGTPAYMAPEQAAADPDTNHRADIYAFGVMAYEMLAGRPPFHGRTAQKLLAAQMSERPEPIQEIRPDTPPLLGQLVMKCLEKEPDARPQSAGDLVKVLETVTSGGGHPAMPAILLGGRRRLWRALGLYAAALLAVALVAKAAIVTIGLPDWVFPGALVVMAMGLPVILFTAFVHRGAYQAITAAALTPGGSPVVHSTMTRLAVKASPWVTWRRTAIGGVIAVSAFAVLVLGFMVLRAMGIGPAGSLLAAGKIKDRERLLITDFKASGKDSSLGSVVTEAVRTDIGQSSVVSIVPASDVAAALSRMQRPDSSRLDLPLAREIAQREGIKGIIDGDITPLAGGYIVTVRLVGAEKGDELAAFRETVEGPKDLLPTLDKLTRRLRGKIGESLRDVHASPPLERVTTPSLEALRLYVVGVRANDYESDYLKAVGLLEQAVKLDTSFAMAYRKLGVALNNAFMPAERVNAALEKAYRYRDRLTERERLLATATYYDFGPGLDRQKAADAYQALIERDSVDNVAVNNMALIAWNRRDFALAESLYHSDIVSRASTFAYANTVLVRLSAGRIGGADSALEVARAALPGNIALATLDIPVLYAHGLVDSAVAQARRARDNRDPFTRSDAAHDLADLAMVRGHLAEGRRLRAEAWSQDTARGAPPRPLETDMQSALINIWFLGRSAQGVAQLDSAVARRPLRSISVYERPDLHLAAVYALAGRVDRARAVLSQYDAEVKDSAVLRNNDPDRHNALGEVALAEHRPLDAVAEFKLSDRLPDGPVNGCVPCVLPRIGRAYDQANMPDSAIATYERYIGSPSWRKFALAQDGQYLAGMHKRLGELYEAKGDRAKALDHYLKFVDLWKDADSDLQPQVAEAKKRIALLKDTETR